MKLGVILPQGWTGEYAGWDPLAAWARTIRLAGQAERLGYESVWLFDHFHTVPEPTDEPTFESFTSLSAIAALTSRVRLGHVVVCTGFRNPALTAKMISTMDVISGGRMTLGIGAGWKREEWLAYGYTFPDTSERLGTLENHLEIITRMLAAGNHNRASFVGPFASVRDAINVPKPVQQPRVPIMVGGNGPTVTWRLAARFADELNLDGMTPAELSAALPTVRARCEEIGRDPASLWVSVHIWWHKIGGPPETSSQARVDLLGEYRDLGIARTMHLLRSSVDADEALESYAADARAAGVDLES
jgi:F420-dependent oxidoreductase-like protein